MTTWKAIVAVQQLLTLYEADRKVELRAFQDFDLGFSSSERNKLHRLIQTQPPPPPARNR